MISPFKRRLHELVVERHQPEILDAVRRYLDTIDVAEFDGEMQRLERIESDNLSQADFEKVLERHAKA